MNKGQTNYFRHSFFARNDIKLLRLKDEVGIGFYFFYFSLLELCGENYSDQTGDEFVFHDSTIRSLWRVNLKKSERIAIKMSAIGLLEFEKRSKTFWFRVPNLPKYLGKYTKKDAKNSPNKERNKEINKEINKEKEKEIKNDFSEALKIGPEKYLCDEKIKQMLAEFSNE